MKTIIIKGQCNHQKIGFLPNSNNVPLWDILSAGKWYSAPLSFQHYFLDSYLMYLCIFCNHYHSGGNTLGSCASSGFLRGPPTLPLSLVGLFGTTLLPFSLLHLHLNLFLFIEMQHLTSSSLLLYANSVQLYFSQFY